MFPIQLGLKASCNPEQMMTRLKYQPDVFEFFTSEKLNFFLWLSAKKLKRQFGPRACSRTSDFYNFRLFYINRQFPVFSI